MLFKSGIGILYQAFVEALFAASGLVASNKNNGLPLGIKGEGNAPDASISTKSKLL